jgi:hypothetical protein
LQAGLHLLYLPESATAEEGTIDATDLNAMDNDASNFIVDYVVTDLNGDGLVNRMDIAIADNNAANFISVLDCEN